MPTSKIRKQKPILVKSSFESQMLSSFKSRISFNKIIYNFSFKLTIKNSFDKVAVLNVSLTIFILRCEYIEADVCVLQLISNVPGFMFYKVFTFIKK